MDDNSNFARNGEYNIYFLTPTIQSRVNDHMRMPEWGAVLKLSLHCYFINFRINFKKNNTRKKYNRIG